VAVPTEMRSGSAMDPTAPSTGPSQQKPAPPPAGNELKNLSVAPPLQVVKTPTQDEPSRARILPTCS
jgi:hypothetical protein